MHVTGVRAQLATGRHCSLKPLHSDLCFYFMNESFTTSERLSIIDGISLTFLRPPMIIPNVFGCGGVPVMQRCTGEQTHLAPWERLMNRISLAVLAAFACGALTVSRLAR